MKPEITKTQVQCYKIRYPNGSYWADITLDIGDYSGRISISSDYGNWANYWGSCGKDFKDFLCKIGIDYFAGKIGEDRFFDLEATLQMYKRNIIHLRKMENISFNEAREMFDQIIELNEASCQQEFINMMFDRKSLIDLYDGCPDTVSTISPMFKRFWEKPWKDFIECLKQETSQC